MQLTSYPLAETRAAAVWRTTTVNTLKTIIQVAVIKESNNGFGGSQTPRLSSNKGAEEPNNDHEINISDERTKIIVTWSSNYPENGNTNLDLSISLAGGEIWASHSY